MTDMGEAERELIMRTWSDPENQRSLHGWNSRWHPSITLPIIHDPFRPPRPSPAIERQGLTFICKNVTLEKRDGPFVLGTIDAVYIECDGFVVDCWPKDMLPHLRDIVSGVSTSRSGHSEPAN